nr:hypothetical protein [Tanacetum cinerariifolium]
PHVGSLLLGKVEEGRGECSGGGGVDRSGGECLLLVPCCWERWKRVVGSVVEVVEWTGVEESGGKTVGGKKGLTVLVLKGLIVLENGKNNPPCYNINCKNSPWGYKYWQLAEMVPLLDTLKKLQKWSLSFLFL